MSASAAEVTTSIGRAMARVTSSEAREQVVAALCSPDRPVVVAFANAHACNVAGRDPAFHADLLGADVLLRDGVGAALLCRRLGDDPGLNMNGTDLIPELIDRYAGRTVALLGTSDPWLGNAARRVGSRARVVLVQDGFAAEDEYVEALRREPAELVVLAMGMPRQERVAVALRAGLDRPCVIVCGGAILDFLGGRVSRAPLVMRRLGIEWAWRLVLEPRRMYKRYVVGNAVFLARLVNVHPV